MTRFLSVAAVAKLRGISTDKVYDDIRTGRLKAHRIGNLFRIQEADARSYQLKVERRKEEGCL